MFAGFQTEIKRPAGIIFLVLLSLCLFSCEPASMTIERDRQKYAPISAERPLGTSCYPGDSASVKRRYSHPLGPTGGWGIYAETDSNRQHDTARNEFLQIAGDVAGYVQFPVSGRLTMRSYDDIYGDVYCGWAPSSVKYTPQAKPVYTIFARCHVGDGGLSKVDELCWFPEDKAQGIVVYSSAYPQKTGLQPSDVFLPRHIGSMGGNGGNKIFYFNEHEADKIFDSLLMAGQRDQVKKLVAMNLDRIEYLPAAVDGSTGKPIPAFEAHCNTVVQLLLLKAGVGLFDPDALQALSLVKKTLKDGTDFCRYHGYAIDLVDFYEWIVKRVQGENFPLPQVPDTANKVVGYNPRVIVQLLADPMITERSRKVCF